MTAAKEKSFHIFQCIKSNSLPSVKCEFHRCYKMETPQCKSIYTWWKIQHLGFTNITDKKAQNVSKAFQQSPWFELTQTAECLQRAWHVLQKCLHFKALKLHLMEVFQHC